MADLTLKKIEEVLDKKLKPIVKKIDNQDSRFGILEEKIDSLTLDMVEVQRKTDAIADIHDLVKGTREQVKDHEERIAAIEQTV